MSATGELLPELAVLIAQRKGASAQSEHRLGEVTDGSFLLRHPLAQGSGLVPAGG